MVINHKNFCFISRPGKTKTLKPLSFFYKCTVKLSTGRTRWDPWYSVETMRPFFLHCPTETVIPPYRDPLIPPHWGGGPPIALATGGGGGIQEPSPPLRGPPLHRRGILVHLCPLLYERRGGCAASAEQTG